MHQPVTASNMRALWDTRHMHSCDASAFERSQCEQFGNDGCTRTCDKSAIRLSKCACVLRSRSHAQFRCFGNRSLSEFMQFPMTVARAFAMHLRFARFRMRAWCDDVCTHICDASTNHCFQCVRKLRCRSYAQVKSICDSSLAMCAHGVVTVACKLAMHRQSSLSMWVCKLR